MRFQSRPTNWRLSLVELSVVRASDQIKKGRGFKSHLGLGFFSEFSLHLISYCCFIYNMFTVCKRKKQANLGLLLNIHSTLRFLSFCYFQGKKSYDGFAFEPSQPVPICGDIRVEFFNKDMFKKVTLSHSLKYPLLIPDKPYHRKSFATFSSWNIQVKLIHVYDNSYLNDVTFCHKTVKKGYMQFEKLVLQRKKEFDFG